MAKFSKAAKRYVKAYFDLAQSQDQLERAAQDMKLIQNTISGNKELYQFLKQPVITNKQKYQVVQQIFKGKISPLTHRLLELLARKNRMDILPDITFLFDEFYKKHLGIVEVKITTATEIDDELKKQFLQKVKELTGKENIALTTEIDPSIIGGYILQIGDLKIDDSIKGKLQKIKSKLIVN